MNICEKIKQAIKENVRDGGDYMITIKSVLKGEDQNCRIEWDVRGIDNNGESHAFLFTNDDFCGADLNEVAGYKPNIPQIKEMMLSDSIDYWFWDNNRFRSTFCITMLCRKFSEFFAQ